MQAALSQSIIPRQMMSPEEKAEYQGFCFTLSRTGEVCDGQCLRGGAGHTLEMWKVLLVWLEDRLSVEKRGLGTQ